MTEIILAISVFVLLYVLWRINKGEVKYFHIIMILGFISIIIIMMCVMRLIN